MFISFANFYCSFIQGFSVIGIPLFLILKIIGLFEELVLKVFRADSNKIVGVNSRTDKMAKNLSKSKKTKNKKSKNLTYIQNIRITKKSIFLISSTREAFNYLR